MTTTSTPIVRSISRFDGLAAGIAGLAGVLVLGATIAFSTTPDVTTPGAGRAIAHWLTAPGTGGTALPALAASATSYIFLLVFLGAVRRLVEGWNPGGIWSSITGISSGLFLAGALVSDAFAWSVPLVRFTAPSLNVPASLVGVLDRGWLISLVEAQVALGTAIAAATVALITARRGGERAPILLIVLGILGSVAVIPLLLLPTSQVVFLVSNQSRLLWIVVVSVWLLIRAVRGSGSSAAPR